MTTIWTRNGHPYEVDRVYAEKAFTTSPLKASPSFHKTIEALAKDGDVIARLLNRAFIYKIYCHPKLSRNYLSMRDKDGEISFTPKGKELIITENGTWSRKGRQTSRPGTLIPHILNPRIMKRLKQIHIKQFADRFRVEESKEKDQFEIVPFDVAYNSTDNAVSSCMVDKPVGDFYNLFGCKALVYRNAGSPTIVGRAILWPEVELHRKNEEVIKFPFMDRIYGSDQVIIKFKQWAEKNDYAFKRNQSTNSPSLVFDNETIELNDDIGDLRVYYNGGQEIPNDIRWYPYIDTFGHQSIDDKPYLTTCVKKGTWAFQYWSTGGGRTDSGYKKGFVFDASTERWVDPSDMIYINGVCYKKEDRQIVELAPIDDSGTPRYALCTDSLISINGLWYLTSDTCLFTCEHSGSYAHIRNMIEIAGKKIHSRYAMYYQVNLSPESTPSDNTTSEQVNSAILATA